MFSPKTSSFLMMLTCGVILQPGGATAASNPFTSLQLNGNAHVGTGGFLKLVGNREQASSAYVTAPLTLDPTFSFTTKFRVLAAIKRSGPQADGFAFVMQNDPSADKALGADGSCLAVCNIQNYAAIAFQSYTNNTAGLWLNGSMDTQPFDLGNQNNDIYVTVTYSQLNTTLAFDAVDKSTGQTVSGSYTVDLSTLGNSIYVGFSGASGGSESHERVVGWSFDYTP